MTKNSCIVANIILGISLACINMLPFIMPFALGTITYIFIACFDIIAIYLSFALDLNFAKQNSFVIKDVAIFVVFPLIIPIIVFCLIYTICILIWHKNISDERKLNSFRLYFCLVINICKNIKNTLAFFFLLW